MNITYTLSLTVTRPVRQYDSLVSVQETAAWMQSQEAQRELEKEVLRTLKKLDGSCDAECLSVERWVIR